MTEMWDQYTPFSLLAFTHVLIISGFPPSSSNTPMVIMEPLPLAVYPLKFNV
jgi:hypothetical protein